MSDSNENKNVVLVEVTTELGCNFDEGEYGLFIYEIVSGCLAKNDYDLIDECIQDNLTSADLPPEGGTTFVLRETGEWEDVHWHKYYEIVPENEWTHDKQARGSAVAMLRNFLEKMQDMDGTDILDMIREDLPELLRVTESGEALDWFEEIQEQLIKAERKRDQFMQAHAETQARAQRLERDCGSLLFVLRNIYNATPTSKRLTEPSEVVFRNAAGAEKKMEILTRRQEEHKARARTLLAGGTKEGFHVEPGTDTFEIDLGLVEKGSTDGPICTECNHPEKFCQCGRFERGC